MTSTPRRMAMLIALAMGLSLALAPAVAAHDSDHVSDLPARIDLPDGWRPEGIESHGKWLFAGSLANGAIWRANAKTGEGKILVPGETGKVAVGLHIDRWGRLGWPVADRRGPRLQGQQRQAPADVLVRDRPDAVLQRPRHQPEPGRRHRLVQCPGRGVPPESTGLSDPSKAFFLPLKGDYQHQPGFNANGIAARGRWLVIVQSGTGFLFRLNPKTGDTKRIDTGGYLVTNGDGLDFRGRTLYVANQLNTVAVLRVGESPPCQAEGRDPSGSADPRRADDGDHDPRCAVGRMPRSTRRPDVDYWITRLPLTPDP